MRLSFVPDSLRLSPTSARHARAAEPGEPGYTPARPASPARTPVRFSRALLAGLLTAALLSVLNLALPRLGKSIANSLPASWIRDASQQMSDRAARPHAGLPVETATVSPQQADFEQLQARFGALSAPEAGAPPYRLVLSREPSTTARLMSLPSGDIILNERFLTSVPDPSARIALLCVELGHLQLRHALRNAVDRKLLRLGAATLLGNEPGSINALGAGLALADYTPEQLLAADRYAEQMLLANDFAPDLLIRALNQAPDNTSPAQFQPAAAQHRQYLAQRIEALRPEH